MKKRINQVYQLKKRSFGALEQCNTYIYIIYIYIYMYIVIYIYIYIYMYVYR